MQIPLLLLMILLGSFSSSAWADVAEPYDSGADGETDDEEAEDDEDKGCMAVTAGASSVMAVVGLAVVGWRREE